MKHWMVRAALALLLTSGAAHPAWAEDIVPLRRGYYVRADIPCERASHATLTLYTGKAFGAQCKTADVQASGHSFRISQQCRDRGYVGRFTQLYRITSDHEYVVGLDGEDIAYRLCPQTELPPQWSSTDLSGLLRCSDTE